jgi:polar amino acid transport system permease protein
MTPTPFLGIGLFQVHWQDYVGDLTTAVLQTLEFTVAAFAGAVVIGLFIAILRLAPIAPLRIVARVYTETFKNLPLVTEIFLV